MSPNHELFVKVLAEIEKHPETWRQEMWATQTACGTSYCFAGHAAVLSGYEFDFEWQRRAHPAADPVQTDSLTTSESGSFKAQHLLGLDFADSSRLFASNNTLADLYRVSADLLGIDETVLRDKVRAEVEA